MDYKTSLIDWLNRAQKIAYGKLSIDEGRKYDRIMVENYSQKSAFCFIEKSTGNVLKPAGWQKPAKHSRGNIYIIGKEGVSEYGALYLR